MNFRRSPTELPTGRGGIRAVLGQVAQFGRLGLSQIGAGFCPRRCLGCDASDLVLTDVHMCEPCAVSLEANLTACPTCAHPAGACSPGKRCAHFDSRQASQVGSTSALDGALVPFLYGGALRDAILRWKHGRREDLGPALGALLAPAAAKFEGRVDVVMPVPIHWRRLMARGFDQSGALAWYVSRRLKPARFSRGLKRTRSTPGLGKMDVVGRAEVLEGAFSCHRPIGGQRVLLVDDVMTTGATFRECAQALSRGCGFRTWSGPGQGRGGGC